MPTPARPLAKRTNAMRRLWAGVLASYAVLLITIIVLPPLGTWLGYSTYENSYKWDRIASMVGIWAIGGVLAVLAALLIGFKATGRLRRTDELLVFEGALVAPFCTSEYTFLPLVGVQVLTQLLGAFTVPIPERSWSAEQIAGTVTVAGLIIAILAGYVVGYHRGNHGLVISSTGLQVPRILGSLLVPWAALDEHTTLPPSRRAAATQSS